MWRRGADPVVANPNRPIIRDITVRSPPIGDRFTAERFGARLRSSTTYPYHFSRGRMDPTSAPADASEMRPQSSLRGERGPDGFR